MTISKLPRPREAVILRQVLDLLQARRVFAWRNQTGALRAGQDGKRYVHFGAVGSADVFAILPPWSTHPGVFLAIETKRPGGKLTDAQARFLQNVQDQWGIAVVVEDVVVLDELLTDLGC
jgi:hypothetical protein